MSTVTGGPRRLRRRGPHGFRVVVTSRIFAPEPAAASFRLKALVEALADDGAEVTVLTTTVPGDAEYHPPTAVRVKRWPVLRDRAGYVRGYLQYLSFDLPLALRLLVVRRPDIVVTEPPPTTGVVVRLVCAVRRIPYGYYAADVWSDASRAAGMPAAIHRTLACVERWVLRGARTVLSVSDEVTTRLRDWGLAGRAVKVGNGIDTDTFTPEGSEHEANGRVIVYAGTASEVHGAGVFVDAMPTVLERFPDARLVFIGQGAELDQIREQARQLPEGAVTFLPRQAPAVVAQWLRRADVAIASVRPGEYGFAFPSKIYAAAACGAPVVYAGTGPAATIVREAALGEAVAYDAAAVAAALVSVLEQPRSEGVPRRVEWARAHASLARAGGRASAALLAATRRQP